jgi:hypothetical protein
MFLADDIVFEIKLKFLYSVNIPFDLISKQTYERSWGFGVLGFWGFCEDLMNSLISIC